MRRLFRYSRIKKCATNRSTDYLDTVVSNSCASVRDTRTNLIAFLLDAQRRHGWGLRAWGKHWPALALIWASSLPRTEGLTKALMELMAHGSTQQIRHGAKRLVFRSVDEG
jgi:hypothetical protein